MNKNIVIAGAGLVGSLLSILLAKQGFNVTVVEKRPDPATGKAESGRSINLALSHRGIKALQAADVAEKVLQIAIPMKGRMLHEPSGKQSLQPYGKEGQVINSVSRSQLNAILIEEAREKYNIKFEFDKRVEQINSLQNSIVFTDLNTHKTDAKNYDILFGADGAFSAVRSHLLKTDRFDYSQTYLEYGYKELHIDPDKEGRHRMEVNALHIWPRENFMLIALPNLDGSFTVTLFLQFDGDNSFEKLTSEETVTEFFRNYFNDALDLMPDLSQKFFSNPTSSLLTVKCFPWVANGNIALIGDAAHAIVPFYGQGMNAGFEDCHVLSEIISQDIGKGLPHILQRFQNERKPDTDAIAELALRNFVEMRDLVADEKFLLRKKIEARISQKYNWYLPLYPMVTFSDFSYSYALKTGDKQEKLMAEIMAIPGIEIIWDKDLLWEKIGDQLEEYKKTL